MSLMDVTTSCVRSAICAAPGKKLVVADLSNIEGRLMAWLAGEKWKLDAFREYDAGTGPDLYKLAFAKSFRKHVDDVADDERQIGKVMELAFQYQGSVGAFNQMSKNYGIFLPEDEVQVLVDAWRAAHPKVVKFWRSLETAAKAAIKKPTKAFKVGKVIYFYDKEPIPLLHCKLPSGRFISYHKPQLRTVQKPWGMRETIYYMGLGLNRRATLMDTYGGKLAENINQAAAMDVMSEGMVLAEENNYPIVLTVHDELVTEVEDAPEKNVDELSALLSTNPDWCQDLPLAAAGYESKFFKKD